ncbi:hypothetical protein CRUP_013017 [Coryphaenoides rupestris]|nr:hypothetical protein CRUP_013017 [Coryphaenoides rupestris]
MVFTSSGAISSQYSRDAGSSTVSIQGSGNHYHACASDDYDDVGFDPSILPPPDPWIDSMADDPLQNPNAHPKPLSSDLACFWDMLQLSIENISLKFDELHQIRANHWKPLDPPEMQDIWRTSPVQKKPPKSPHHHHSPLARDRSLESSEKQKQEARKRLMAVKQAASVRQNSATESADSIEIYIPEAQTRL